MWRAHGIPLTFPIVNENDLKSTRELGELVALNNDGKVIVNPVGDEGVYFPLIADIKADSKDADVTVTGVAKIKVEDITGLHAGSTVGIGATKKGIAVFVSGYSLGIALETPKANGDYIPVLLVHNKTGAQY